MKKNKKIITLALISLSILPEIASATEYLICDNNKRFPAVAAQMTSTFITIIKIAVPILLVLSGMISFIKVTYASNVEDQMKKAKTKLINNIIAAGIIFFVFSIVNFAVSMVAGPNNRFINCAKCFIDVDKCNTVELTDEEIENFGNSENEQQEQETENNETQYENEQSEDKKNLLEATADYQMEISGIKNIKELGEDVIEFDVGGLIYDATIGNKIRTVESGIGVIKSIFD